MKACLCYTCDSRYLLATLVSSTQARANLSCSLADVVVIVVGGLDDSGGAISRLFGNNNVLLHVVSRTAIDDLGIQFARHYLDRLLDPAYEKIFHIDSDTQISGSLDPLFELELPYGTLVAAPDPLAVRIHETGRFWEQHRVYFKSIGISDSHVGRYVNTGLFGAWRKDLACFSRECVRICRQRDEPLRFIEQDAVNIAFAEQIRHISMRWNYPSFFSNCGFDKILQPRVHHFMSNPRPWDGPFRPWGRRAYQVYVDAIHREPQLAPYARQLPFKKALKYRAQQRVKQVMEYHSWARPHVRMRLAQLEGEAIV